MRKSKNVSNKADTIFYWKVTRLKINRIVENCSQTKQKTNTFFTAFRIEYIFLFLTELIYIIPVLILPKSKFVLNIDF